MPYALWTYSHTHRVYRIDATLQSEKVGPKLLDMMQDTFPRPLHIVYLCSFPKSRDAIASKEVTFTYTLKEKFHEIVPHDVKFSMFILLISENFQLNLMSLFSFTRSDESSPEV